MIYKTVNAVETRIHSVGVQSTAAQTLRSAVLSLAKIQKPQTKGLMCYPCFLHAWREMRVSIMVECAVLTKDPMRFVRQLGFLFCLIFGASAPLAAECDLSQYRAQPGLSVARERDALSVSWDGEAASRLRLRFSIASSTPTIRELSVRDRGGPWVTLGRDLMPFFAATSGIRRTGHGLPEEKRWDVYWDAPLQRPDEVRHHTAQFQAAGCAVKTEGSRLAIQFPGVTMGIFSGSLQFTVYRGTNLIREELIAKTEEPSVAYIYSGGLKGFSTALLSQVTWQDVGGNRQSCDFSGAVNQDLVPLRAKHRLAIAKGKSGSVAVFPQPHQFFFARELEINLGYVWYRKDSASSFSLGVRQHPTEEGYNPEWIKHVYALYNAPPGTWQRMSVYFYAQGADAAEVDAMERAVLAFTHNDRYKELPGYKTMVTHFHTAFTEELIRSGSLDTQPPWVPAMKALGVNIAYIDDFHGDGHPNDPGPLRLQELDSYYQACRRHSDRNFLILPGEEANVYLGGHYNILFPKPVYWTHVRQSGRQFIEQDTQYGTVYRASNAAEVFEMIERENALVWQTHPRTKGSTFYPDKIRDEDYFRSDQWLGAAFKPLPLDLSQKRLCEVRCFKTLDDMNNWGRPKFMLAEVDTYKKWPQDELYGPFVVNYLKLNALPAGDNWSAILRVLRAGDFFVTTGEVLIREFGVHHQGASVQVTADLEWTFPLEFVELVWGDGNKTDRKILPATDTSAFGRKRFTVPIGIAGKKWVRLAAWDAAGNGAFTQPVHLK